MAAHILFSPQVQEVGEALSTGKSTETESNKILGTRRLVVQTTIDVVEATNGSCSVLKIATRDRPGLLVRLRPTPWKRCRS